MICQECFTSRPLPYPLHVSTGVYKALPKLYRNFIADKYSYGMEEQRQITTIVSGRWSNVHVER